MLTAARRWLAWWKIKHHRWCISGLLRNTGVRCAGFHVLRFLILLCISYVTYIHKYRVVQKVRTQAFVYYK